MSGIDVDAKMHRFEDAHNLWVLPGLYVVARLNGHDFAAMATRHFERPFDIRLRDILAETMHDTMLYSGFHIIYGYLHSDEITFLLHPNEDSYCRSLRKMTSLLAGDVSARFAARMAANKIVDPIAFDCRIAEIPEYTDVIDYFVWRQDAAERNTLLSHCRSALPDYHDTFEQMTTAQLREVLANLPNASNLRHWQVTGCGITIEPHTAITKALITHEILMTGEAYRQFVERQLAANHAHPFEVPAMAVSHTRYRLTARQ